jgi:hypothetical protein
MIFKILDGDITGRGPKTKEERDRLERSGWMPYSVKIGDKYYSYRGFEPLSTWLGLMADYAEGNREENMAEAIGSASSNLARNFSENPFLTGMADFIDLIRGEQTVNVPSVVAGFALGTTVPTIVQQSTAIFDPTRRKTETILEAVKAKIPGLSKTLIPRRNIFGKPVEVPNPAGRLFALGISPVKSDAVEQELKRLDMNLGWPSGMFEGIKLTPEQHDKLVKISGEGFKKTLDLLVSRPIYKAFPDESKRQIIRKIQQDIINTQRMTVLTDLYFEGLGKKIEKEMTGGVISDEQRERTMEAYRKAIGR